jgi:hypothetical protein
VRLDGRGEAFLADFDVRRKTGRRLWDVEDRDGWRIPAEVTEFARLVEGRLLFHGRLAAVGSPRLGLKPPVTPTSVT